MLWKICETDMNAATQQAEIATSASSSHPRNPNRKRQRIALYSHDTMGMGHIRRNLLIASALVKNCPNVETLLISGTREAAYFATQAGLDCITLPALSKNLNGQYSARHWNWSLEETTRLRSKIIAAAMDEFAPDVFIVDKMPQGIGHELVTTLKNLQSCPTTCVLGLRDVLDEPEVVAREWQGDDNDAAIEAYYDELWIYGDRSIYDCIDECRFSKTVASRAFFTGYLNQSDRRNGNASRSPVSAIDSRTNKLALCVVGGGQDGYYLAESFVRAQLPLGWRGQVITGPFMPKPEQFRLRELANQNPAIEIIDHLVETDDYLRDADRVIAMGGYNTITSILSFQKPSLIVPRVRPRREQWIRAERLSNQGWITSLSPDHLNTLAIESWLHAPEVPSPKPGCVDLLGLDRISHRVESLESRSRIPA